MLSLSQIFDDFWPVSGRLVFFVMNEFSNFLFDFIEFGVPTSVSVQNISQMIGRVERLGGLESGQTANEIQILYEF